MVGCSSPTPTPPPADALPVVVVPVLQPTPTAPPVEPFRFSTDAIARTLAPTAPPSPTLPNRTAPVKRTSPLDGGELPPAKLAAGAVPRLSPKVWKSLPSSPTERVPRDLALGISVAFPGEIVPPKPTVRTPTVSPTAADVPAMAKYVADRVSLDDPTAALSAERIVNTPLAPPGPPPAVLRPTIPDPFEFAEQVKPRPTPEPIPMPVAVPAMK